MFLTVINAVLFSIKLLPSLCYVDITFLFFGIFYIQPDDDRLKSGTVNLHHQHNTVRHIQASRSLYHPPRSFSSFTDLWPAILSMSCTCRPKFLKTLPCHNLVDALLHASSSRHALLTPLTKSSLNEIQMIVVKLSKHFSHATDGTSKIRPNY